MFNFVAIRKDINTTPGTSVTSCFKFLHTYQTMSLIKVPWYVLRVKNMNSWSPLDPYGTLGEEKLSFSVLEKENKNGNTSLQKTQWHC